MNICGCILQITVALLKYYYNSNHMADTKKPYFMYHCTAFIQITCELQ